ncbi:MAG: hypothetical protein K6E51_09965 [Treponema sp.]|nr:hypothetical protein [Treponema sp.]
MCPQDNATIVASEYKDNRIGVDALRLSLISDQVQGDVYWIPVFTPSTLLLSKNNPLRPIVFPDKVEGTSITYFNSINDLELPEKKLANSEYALRLTAYLPIMDFSL